MKPQPVVEGPRILIAPDCGSRVEIAFDYDERSGAWYRLLLVELPAVDQLLCVSARSMPEVDFLEAGEVRLAWNDGWGRQWKIHVQVAQRTFHTGPGTKSEALSELFEKLAPPQPCPEVSSAADAAPRARRRVSDLVACTALATTGGWMAWLGQGAGERLVGFLGLAFFSACLWLMLREPRRPDRDGD